MTIIRVVKDSRERFLITDIEVHRRKDLSWEARGLHAYLMSQPDNWEVRVTDLMEAGPAGKDKLQRMLRELQEAGYVNRTRTRDKKTGQLATSTEVYERVDLNPNTPPTYGGNGVTTAENPPWTTAGLPAAGKPGRLIKNDLNKETYRGGLRNFETDPSALPENSFHESQIDRDALNSMVSVLSGICKGFANVLDPPNCDFHKAAATLIQHGHTEEDVHGFAHWWKSNGHYGGKPAVKSLLLEFENYLAGVSFQGTNGWAEASWEECQLWVIGRKRFADFSDALTAAVIKNMGESRLRGMGNHNKKAIRNQYFETYQRVFEQHGVAGD